MPGLWDMQRRMAIKISQSQSLWRTVVRAVRTRFQLQRTYLTYILTDDILAMKIMNVCTYMCSFRTREVAMIEAISCGGVVIFRGKILLLYKNSQKQI